MNAFIGQFSSTYKSWVSDFPVSKCLELFLEELWHQSACMLPTDCWFECSVLCVHRAKMIDGDGSDFYLDTHQVGSDADDE
jgi:hypothetical protein